MDPINKDAIQLQNQIHYKALHCGQFLFCFVSLIIFLAKYTNIQVLQEDKTWGISFTERFTSSLSTRGLFIIPTSSLMKENTDIGFFLIYYVLINIAAYAVPSFGQ